LLAFCYELGLLLDWLRDPATGSTVKGAPSRPSFSPFARQIGAIGCFPVEKPAALDYGRAASPAAFPCSASWSLTAVPQQRTSEAHGFSSSKLSVLRKHPIFADLEPEAFEQLCRYAKHSTLKRGTTLFSKGDPGISLYAVIAGTVKMSISSSEGRNAILNIIGPGEIFGEMALLDGGARSADAIANSNCELFVIDRREFIPFVKSQPALAMKFIELLCERLRRTSDQVEQIILQNLPGRLASALLRLSEKHKFAPQGRTIAITQQEISEMVGMTRESINKQLRAWAARDWVRLEHGAIVVLNAEMLRELADAGSASESE
jgi:CRP/FNR family cyclic AMP-dependent transcriptional regulator